MTRAALAALTVTFLSSTASADTKSWMALKSKLPKDTAIVVSIDANAVRKSPSFPKLIDWLVQEDKDIGQMLEVVKASCGMELPAMIGDASLAFDLEGHGVVAIGLSGLDQTKLVACANSVLAKVDPKLKLASKAVGKLTEYTMQGEKAYAAWLAPDVVVIGTDASARGELENMLAGSAATGDLATFLGKAGTSAGAFAAFAVNQEGFKGGYGTLTLGSTLKLAARLTAMTPADGQKGRDDLKKQVKEGLDRSKKQPELKKVFQGVKIGGKGAEVTLDASLPEASLPAVLPAFDKVF